jgi:hypothetical protein
MQMMLVMLLLLLIAALEQMQVQLLEWLVLF